ILGHLAVMHTSRLEKDPNQALILRIFAARAGAELERQRAEEEIRFLLSTTQAIAEAENFNSALSLILDSCCDFINWDFGEAWIPNQDETHLEYSQSRCTIQNSQWLDSALAEFRQQSLSVTFTPGVGLPGRIWSSQQPEWLEDVSLEPSQLFERHQMAVGVGLKTGFGIPILINDQVLAILVFFKREATPLQPHLVEVIQAVATQVASLIGRKRVEEQLRKSEERWQLALNGNNDGVWDWNINTHETFRSARLLEILGYEEHEMGNSNNEWIRHIHPDDVERVMQANHNYLERKTPYYAIEHRLRCRDGTYKWVLSRGQAQWDEAGKPIRMVGSTSDITPRKIAEEKLRASEARLAEAQRVAHVGNWEFNLLTQEISWSEEMLHIFGLDSTQSEPTLEDYVQRIHPDDRPWWQRTVRKSIVTGQSYKLDFRIVHSDYSIHYLEGKGEAVVNEQGQVIKLFGTVLDITPRKKAEEALRQAKVREREKAQQLEVTLNELKHAQTQLIQSEKMSSLGRMVAGIAHEINNPVSFIYGNLTPAKEYFRDLISLLELYQNTYPNPTPKIRQQAEEFDLEFVLEDWSKLLHSMQNGAERIEQIVLSLKNFAQLNESELKRIDIHEGIEETLVILQYRFRGVGNQPGIEVIKNYGQLP
ncbi:MAG TPA: PAS domain-containing protein, partial [Stenomitos sp.]